MGHIESPLLCRLRDSTLRLLSATASDPPSTRGTLLSVEARTDTAPKGIDIGQSSFAVGWLFDQFISLVSQSKVYTALKRD